MNALSAPIAMGISEKPTTIRFSTETRRLQVKLTADARGMSVTGFVAWCVDQLLDLAFLHPLNRAFIRERAIEHRPNSDLDAIDDVVTEYRELVEQGKVAAPVRSTQQRKLLLFEGR